LRDPYDSLSDFDALPAPISDYRVAGKWSQRQESWKGSVGDFEVIKHGAGNIMHFISEWGIAWACEHFNESVDRYGKGGWWVTHTEQLERILAQAETDELTDHAQWQQLQDQNWYRQQEDDDNA